MQKKLSFTGGSRKRGALHAFCATLLLAFFMLGGVSQVYAQWNTWCYKDCPSSTTMKLPQGCDHIIVEAIGGGGAGGAAHATGNYGTAGYHSYTAGGGGGSYARGQVQANLSDVTLTITVGDGGYSYSNGQKQNGGTSSVTYSGGTIVSAPGGGSVSLNSNSRGAGGTGATGNLSTKNGGNGGQGADNRDGTWGTIYDRVLGGSGGGAAGGDGDGSQGNASNNTTPGSGGNGGGGGAASPMSGNWLKGGTGATGPNGSNGWASSNAGTGYGSGGSGCRTQNSDVDFIVHEVHSIGNGGAGGKGFVRVWYHISKELTVSATAENSTICSGGSTQLHSTVSNSLGDVTYKWSNNSTIVNPRVSPTQNTNYKVTITDKITSPSACQATAVSNQVTVNVTDFTFSVGDMTDQHIREGQSATLTANVTEQSGITYTYTWNDGVTGKTRTVNPTSTTQYTVSVTADKNGCTKSDSKSVTVHLFTLNPKADAYMACAGEVVKVEAEGITAGYSYEVYTQATGGTYSNSSDHTLFTKTNSSTEYAYIQPMKDGINVGDRIAIPVLASAFCGGSEEDHSCGTSSSGTSGTNLYYEDFGGNSTSDPNFASSDGGFSSAMTFVPGNVPGRGGYGILKHIPGWPDFKGFPAVAGNSDHTHSGDITKGYFMFIDPSDNSMGQTVAETTISNLCDNSELTFSFWASDMWGIDSANAYAAAHDGVQPSTPKFDMQLVDPDNGHILVQTSVCTPARTATQSWHQFGVKYAIPAGRSSVKFRLVNRENNGMGNDYGIDDIKVSFCGVDVVQHNPDITVCEEEQVKLMTTVTVPQTVVANPRFKWQKSSSPDGPWLTLADTEGENIVISGGVITADANYVVTNSAATTDAGYYRMFVADVDNISNVPDNSKCAVRTEEDFHVIVNPKRNPVFSDLQSSYCYGATVTLPTTDDNGIVGTWSPATVNTTPSTTPNTQTYTFTPTDMTCAQTYEKQITVQNPTVADILVTPKDTICSGETATLSVPEVSGNTYKWSTNEITASITVNATGTYKVTVTSGGCQSFGDTLIVVNPRPTVTPAVTAAKCKGSTDGQVVLTISNAEAPYQVKWNGATTAETVTGTTYTKTNLPAGTYSAEVSSKGCPTTVTGIVVGQPAADLAVANITSTPESCDGNDAIATVEVTGGTAPYTVRLVDGSNTLTPTMVEGKYKFTDLTSGAPTTTSKTYTVSVTDANACTPTSTSPGSVTITLYNPLDMHNITIPAVCSGYEFSYIPADVTDGTLPTGTTYSWPAPDPVTNITGLAASDGNETRIHGTLENSSNAPITVYYTVTPKLGVCVGNPTPSSVTIQAAATINPVVHAVDIADQPVCPTAGTITIDASFTNVNSVHSVVWMMGPTTDQVAVQTTNNMAASVTTDSYYFDVPNTKCDTTYNFEVKYTDESGCTASDGFAVIVRIPAWSINVSTTDFPTSANVECQAAATAPTNVPTGNDIKDGCNQPTTRTLYSTVADPTTIEDQGTVTYTYRYTACDGSYNDWQFVYTVDDQTNPSFNADVITSKPATVPSPANCTFFVPNLAPDVIGSVEDNCTTTETDFTITQEPPAGTPITQSINVRVTVTDKAGNSNYTDVQVTVPTPVTANVTGESAITNVSCHGGNDGSFTVTASNGKQPYQYSLDGGAYQTSSTFSPLTAGTYSVMVKDANNCTIATPITVTVTEPDALHIDGFPTDNVSEFCDPGEGYATVTWTAPTFGPSDNNAKMMILVEYPDRTTANALPTDNHYPVGTTTITYTASNDCPEEVVKSFTITVIDNQPPCIGCVPGNLDPEATDGNSCAKIIASETNNITLAAGTFTYQHSGNNWDVTAADNDGIKSLTYNLTGATSGNGNSLNGVTFNVGKTTVTWTAVDNSDLTDQCSFDVIVKAQVTVTANSEHFDYNGNPHSDNRYVLTSGTSFVSNGTSGTPVDLPNNDKLTAVITGTITNAGSVPNVVDNVTIMRGTEDMTEYYVITKVNGVLTVDKTDLYIIDSVFNKIYDGTPLVLDYSDIAKKIGLATGDALVAGKVITDDYIAGHYTYNYPVLDGGSYVAGTMDDNGTASIVVPFQTMNGIENYNVIIRIYGTIVPRDITITGGDATKTYDGTALTNSTYSYDNLAETDDITTVTVTGSQVCVGQSANVPSNAEIKHRSDNVTVNNSYNITYVDGELSVTDIPADNLTCPPQYDIVLWYGRCDTVAYMPAFPTLSPNVAYPDVKFVSNIDEFNPLQPGQTYNITWSVLDACGVEMASTHCTQVVTVSYPPCDTVEDLDGFRYGAKRIGCDCWTVDNLRSTQYSDGTPVNKYWRYKDSDSLENIYGKLYTWYSAAGVTEDDDMAVPAEVITTTGAYVQGICPEGWALPKMAEFWTMYNVSGGQAGLVKSPSSLVWLPERAGIAENKFNAFGAGYYAPTIERYENLLGETHFWASDTSRTAMMAKNFELNYYCENGLENLEDKGLGYSIRCVKKEPVFECGVTGVSDLQGNGYGTMQVGNQCWMTENVRFRTDDFKPVVDQDGNEMDPRIFGYLYTWNSIMNGETPGDNVQGICPKGWHIPTSAEWDELQGNFANEPANVCDNTVGKAMASTFGWINSTVNCAVGNEPANNNNTHFNAMPVGGDNPACNGFGNITNFWTATESGADKANVRDLNYNSPDMSNYAADKTSYIPLRCVKNL